MPCQKSVLNKAEFEEAAPHINIIARSTVDTTNTVLVGMKELDYNIGATAKGLFFLYKKIKIFLIYFFKLYRYQRFITIRKL